MNDELVIKDIMLYVTQLQLCHTLHHLGSHSSTLYLTKVTANE